MFIHRNIGRNTGMRAVRAAWRRGALLLLGMFAAVPALAQIVSLPKREAPAYAIGYGAVGGAFTAVDASHPMPVDGRQETLALATGNAVSAPTTVYGGDYVFAQDCSGYGSLALRVRGADGATMQPVVTRTASDAAGGTGVALGSGAVVDVALTGTSGCNAMLTRVP